MSIAHKSNVIVPHTCRRSTLGFLLHVGLSPEASKRPNKLILSSSPVVIPPTTEEAIHTFDRKESRRCPHCLLQQSYRPILISDPPILLTFETILIECSS